MPERHQPCFRKVDLNNVGSRNDDSDDREDDSMEAAIDRIMQTYDLLVRQSAEATAETRAKVTEYINTLFEAGERDSHRLTVCGLAYLRQLDGTADPVKEGYTGL